MNWELELVTVNQPVPGELNKMLAERGADGWELVSHTAPSQEYSDQWTFSFKRPLVDSETIGS